MEFTTEIEELEAKVAPGTTPWATFGGTDDSGEMFSGGYNPAYHDTKWLFLNPERWNRDIPSEPMVP